MDYPIQLAPRIAAFNIFDFGATGDGTTDDAPAFQTALNAMKSAGGGILEIPSRTPAGVSCVYAWKSAVSINFTPGSIGPRSYFEFRGHGASILVTTASAPYVALTLTNTYHFKISGLKVYGTLDKAHPATAPNPISNFLYAAGSTVLIERSEFNGLKIAIPDPNPGAAEGTNAVLYGTSLFLDRVTFASIGGAGRATIKLDSFVDFDARHVIIADFYFVDDVAMAPNSDNPPFTAILLYAPQPVQSGVDSIYGAGTVHISDLRVDEGQAGVQMLRLGVGPTYIKQVVIDGLNMNVSPTNASIGIYLDHVLHAELRNLFIREGGAGSLAIDGAHVGDVLVTNYVTDAAAPLKTIGLSSTSLLRVVNSDVDVSSSSATQIIIESNGAFNDPAYTSGGRPAANSVRAGTRIYNTTTHIPNISDGTNWRDAAGNVV